MITARDYRAQTFIFTGYTSKVGSKVQEKFRDLVFKVCMLASDSGFLKLTLLFAGQPIKIINHTFS